MPEPTNTTFVEGVGQVITSEEEFSDFDAVDGDRFSDRQDDVPEAPEDDETPDDGGNAEWSDKPWLRGQSEKYPHTVREGPSITEQLDISVAAELARWNEIQAMAHPSNGPSANIVALDRQFYNGSWFIYVSYAKLSYQKI